MSYTMLDWLHDNFANKHVRDELVEQMREDGRVIVRMPDMDALIRFAEAHGVGDSDDNDNWGRGEINDAALMAISNWRKERRDWTSE